MSRQILLSLASMLIGLGCAAAGAQDKNAPPPDGKKQPSGESSSARPDESSSVKPDDSSSSKAGDSSAAGGNGTNYDPYHAEQDVEVGTFYMHKGDLDAAIGRFEDAIRLRANFAKPRILLAAVYEKKGDKTTALKYYKEYLQVFPDAPDAKKIRQKIDKLQNR